MDGYKEIALKVGSVFVIIVVVTGLLLWAMLLLPVFHATTSIAISAANSSTYADKYSYYIAGLKMVPIIMVCLVPVGCGFWWIWQILRSPLKG
jgi:flagellar basal body-associated protein FliL